MLVATWDMERLREEAKPLEAIREANEMANKMAAEISNDLAKWNKDKFYSFYEEWVSVRDTQCNEHAGIVFVINDDMVVLWSPDGTNKKAPFTIIKLTQLLEVWRLTDEESDSDMGLDELSVNTFTRESNMRAWKEKAWENMEEVNAGIARLQKNLEDVMKDMEEMRIICDGVEMPVDALKKEELMIAWKL